MPLHREKELTRKRTKGVEAQCLAVLWCNYDNEKDAANRLLESFFGSRQFR